MNLGDDAESAEPPHLKLREIIAGHVLDHPSTGVDQSPITGGYAAP
jgi:hypothetical protein